MHRCFSSRRSGSKVSYLNCSLCTELQVVTVTCHRELEGARPEHRTTVKAREKTRAEPSLQHYERKLNALVRLALTVINRN